jgi:hypothetical protein
MGRWPPWWINRPWRNCRNPSFAPSAVWSKLTDVAVLSGRAMADVRRRVGIRSIVYGGNHGVEIVGPGVRYLNPVAQKLKKQTQTFFEAARLSFPGCSGVCTSKRRGLV